MCAVHNFVWFGAWLLTYAVCKWIIWPTKEDVMASWLLWYWVGTMVLGTIIKSAYNSALYMGSEVVVVWGCVIQWSRRNHRSRRAIGPLSSRNGAHRCHCTAATPHSTVAPWGSNGEFHSMWLHWLYTQLEGETENIWLAGLQRDDVKASSDAATGRALGVLDQVGWRLQLSVENVSRICSWLIDTIHLHVDSQIDGLTLVHHPPDRD